MAMNNSIFICVVFAPPFWWYSPFFCVVFAPRLGWNSPSPWVVFAIPFGWYSGGIRSVFAGIRPCGAARRPVGSFH